MASYSNFDRQYRLAAGAVGTSGFEIGASTYEQPIPLHISFSFEKSDLETQNTGKIDIWNLSKEHLAVLNSGNCYLSLRAGYGNNISLIFAGIVSYASTEIDNSDRRTEIEVIDNLIEIRDTYVSISYNASVNWKTIFDDVAAQMGVAVSYSYNAVFADISNGFSFVGQARDILSKGCDCCGLSWSLQNGVLQIKQPGDVMSKDVYLLSPETGMVGIPTRVVVSQDDETGVTTMGWDVTYLLNGAINIDDYVKVESDTVTGYFRVYSIEIAGDNLSGDWTCKARLLEVS